jgi:hypothetical protein
VRRRAAHRHITFGGPAADANLRTADTAFRSAGAKLAAVLRSVGFTPRLTAARAAQGISRLRADLAAAGVGAAEVLRMLGGAAIAAKPLDPLDLLGR